ncbi:MAG: hypothetical protein JRJ49_02695 [Deltaproteobacteria bacterium]|nr:hypothetical protein [Deltaproteobacteria bacterium]
MYIKRIFFITFFILFFLNIDNTNIACASNITEANLSGENLLSEKLESNSSAFKDHVENLVFKEL